MTSRPSSLVGNNELPVRRIEGEAGQEMQIDYGGGGWCTWYPLGREIPNTRKRRHPALCAHPECLLDRSF